MEVIPSEQGGPYAFKTLLGWCLVGTIGETTFDTTVACNRISVQDKVSKNVASHYFARETEVPDIGIEQMLKKICTAEFNDNATSRAAGNITKIALKDRKFFNLMERERSKAGNHYKLPLPLKNPHAVFPNNKRMAELRLKNLKKRFIKDKQYHKDLISFMEDKIKKGYAEKSDPKANQQGKTWFIPHHGVYHPSKPGKIRIAFDCSVEYDGVSVNKRLLSGPDLTNQIVGILVKFREDYVAIMADIEAMFYQVFVANQHRSLLSFLWWENGDIKEEPQRCHMNVHVFGEASSPQVTVILHHEEQLGIMKSSMIQKLQTP